jgi:DNA-binding NarL/FixJ family response regulator
MSRRPQLRVLVADDNPVVRAGLTALLTGREDITVVAEATDGREAQEAAQAHRPDVILLDARMPGVDGLTALPQLAELAPVLMLTYSREPGTVREALRRGAGGYLVHGEFTAEELVSAVRDVTRGGSGSRGRRRMRLQSPRCRRGPFLRKTFRRCNGLWHSLRAGNGSG